ncbi:hypothetical protein ACH4E8_34280 [Streptomyces sp. NPDC017979]|uniref:hypothetical protein n=1 Tax=Streptomyces sp. NPDC017979 TaxID=3365024 RepID=UPI00378F847B
MATWGASIVIAEPAPTAARPARYLAPKLDPDEAKEAAEMTPIAFLLLSVLCILVFGGGGAGVGSIAASVFGESLRVPAWIAFDVAIVISLTLSYSLTARYGLRFPDEHQRLRKLAETGNVAWSCLPEPQKAENTERLRSMNAAARLLVVNSKNAEAKKVLEQTSQHLNDLALAVLPAQRKAEAAAIEPVGPNGSD